MKSSENKRPVGNPDFGKKWRPEPIGDKPLTKTLGVRMDVDMHAALKKIAQKEDKHLGEVIRRAIALYLENEQISS